MGHRMSAAMIDGVTVEEGMVFNTIACLNSLNLRAAFQRQASGILRRSLCFNSERRWVEGGHLISFESRKIRDYSITVLRQFRHSLEIRN